MPEVDGKIVENLSVGSNLERLSSLKISDETLQAAARIRVGLTPKDRVVAFTGIAAEDGVGSLAMEISIALSRIEQEMVLMIQGQSEYADPARRVDSTSRPGLLETIAGDATLESAARDTDIHGLYVMPCGNMTQETISLLSSERAREVFGTLRQRFRYVCMDVGHLLTSPCSIFLARLSDGVVLALAAGHRRREEVDLMRREMEATKLKLLGIVLTSRR
jgi:hypothetical protein